MFCVSFSSHLSRIFCVPTFHNPRICCMSLFHLDCPGDVACQFLIPIASDSLYDRFSFRLSQICCLSASQPYIPGYVVPTAPHDCPGYVVCRPLIPIDPDNLCASFSSRLSRIYSSQLFSHNSTALFGSITTKEV